jgi:hypothetical protein
VLGAEIERGDLDERTADELAARILGGNAQRLYGLEERPSRSPQGGTNL